jgi:hypothetical protein
MALVQVVQHWDIKDQDVLVLPDRRDKRMVSFASTHVGNILHRLELVSIRAQPRNYLERTLQEDQLYWRRNLVARTLRRQGSFLKRVCRYDKNDNIMSADWCPMTPAEIELEASRLLRHRRCRVKDPNFELDVLMYSRDTMGTGDVRFCKHVQTLRKEYAATRTSRERQRRIVESVMDSVHASGGRFLSEEGPWSWYSIMDAYWAWTVIDRLFDDASPK